MQSVRCSTEQARRWRKCVVCLRWNSRGLNWAPKCARTWGFSRRPTCAQCCVTREARHDSSECLGASLLTCAGVSALSSGPSVGFHTETKHATPRSDGAQTGERSARRWSFADTDVCASVPTDECSACCTDALRPARRSTRRSTCTSAAAYSEPFSSSLPLSSCCAGLESPYLTNHGLGSL